MPRDFKKIMKIIEKYKPLVDPMFLMPSEEFKRRFEIIW